MSARLTPLLVVLLGAAGILWATFQYGVSSGVDRERARWERAAAAAEASSREQEQADTVASEGARDAAAVEAREASADARDQKTQTIETIRYVYRDRPSSCPAAEPLPDSVRDSLSAAHDALTAAAR